MSKEVPPLSFLSFLLEHRAVNICQTDPYAIFYQLCQYSGSQLSSSHFCPMKDTRAYQAIHDGNRNRNRNLRNTMLDMERRRLMNS
ncbi:hypothetical protein BCR39DRAFT_6474 [Naematelia encephala]|uniref:Uncharacterized protein n=1 Tax=Naematelia encephala TaxID=71784 RepID=A0A1Y2BKX1_9TREE|nr:hypothetical protein BCR39DRAFT_6474 [Naematelia encephala]